MKFKNKSVIIQITISLFLIFIIVAALYFYYDKLTVINEKFESSESALSDKHLDVAAYYKSSEEREAIHADWPSVNEFRVFVLKSSRNRDNYADYVCSTLTSTFKMSGKELYVGIYYTEFIGNKEYIKKIGSHDCSDKMAEIKWQKSSGR